MRALRNALLAIAMFGLTALCRPSMGQELGSLDGRWEGQLRLIASDIDSESDAFRRAASRYQELTFRIVVQGQRADVYVGDTEVKPRMFETHAFQTNAVIFASSAGEDAEGPWVETWAFSSTQKNASDLIVCLSRVVNNLKNPKEGDGGKFFVFAAGEFHRKSP